MQLTKFILTMILAFSGIGIIALVLMQQGKGADAGAGFGGAGGANSVFGAAGSANFLSRGTAFLAVVFFSTTIALNWLIGYKPQTATLLDRLAKPQATTTATPALPNNNVPK